MQIKNNYRFFINNHELKVAVSNYCITFVAV